MQGDRAESIDGFLFDKKSNAVGITTGLVFAGIGAKLDFDYAKREATKSYVEKQQTTPSNLQINYISYGGEVAATLFLAVFVGMAAKTISYPFTMTYDHLKSKYHSK